ncbi:MAG: peroxiredoxin family protein [Pirellulaceae bacterium]
MFSIDSLFSTAALPARWHLAVATMWIAAAASGCGYSGTQQGEPAALVTADTLLQSTVDAYKSATAYQDQGVVRLRYRRDGRTMEDEAPLSVSWQSPKCVRVQAYQVHMACDGEHFVARLQDAATGDLDGQFVDRPAPAKLTLEELYDHDEILGAAFRQGLIGFPPQLELLFGAQPLAALRGTQATRRLLDPSTIDGRACSRIGIDTPEGRFVLWIDQESHAVRRIEYPAAAFAPEMAQDESVEDVQLTAELRGATFVRQSPREIFALEVPPQAKRVKRFVPPPRALPSELFGKSVAPFGFSDLTGGTVSSESLGDRIKVLVWFNNHPACQANVQQLSRVYQQYKAQDRIAILAVCVEPSTVSESQVADLTRLWQVDLPTVRDVKACGRDLFQVPWAPTLIVLDGKNVVQIFEVGANLDLAAELPQVLERLLAGENLAAEILDQFSQARRAYQLALERGEPDATTAATDIPPVASATSPQLLQIQPLWSLKELQAAGNILAVDDPSGDTKFLVHEGWRTIVELDGAGRIVDRHTLDLPEMAAVSQLQSTVDANNQRYYVAWSLRNLQAHVFDSRWRRVLSYPPSSVQHDGIQDALLADLDENGTLELCVGFWGTTGVHCVSLDGSPVWTNNQVSHVLSLAVAGRKPQPVQLWVASASGQMVALDSRGQTGSLTRSTEKGIHHVFAGTIASPEATPYCGIAYEPDGQRLAVSLNPEPRPRWQYSLPAGSFSNPIRFVTTASLLGAQDYQWLIAGPEGSLHIIGQDGNFTDHFQTGTVLAGMAGGRHGSQGILVISGPAGVQAWQVSPLSTAARPQP